MKNYITLFILILSFSCKPDPQTFTEHINGYWEIDHVELSNGEKKDYTINTAVDLFDIKPDLIGIRRKLKPKLDGQFEVTGDTETVQLKFENDSLNVYYKTPYSKWKETLIFADEEELQLVNASGTTYFYKRFTPITIK